MADLADISLQPINELARRAGDVILEVYARDFSIEEKEDKTPVTEADKQANEVILTGLKQLYPEIPFISEETKATDYQERKSWPLFWMIDPLDGTKEFINQNGEFTVNIALIQAGVSVGGVVYQPVTGTLYYALQGQGAFKVTADGKEVRLENKTDYTERDLVRVIASRSHMSEETTRFIDDLKKQGKTVELISSGSSLKLCLVAEGTADVYPRFAPTMEWDTAAAHAVVTEAGRSVLNQETRQPLIYNKQNLLNPWFIVQ